MRKTFSKRVIAVVLAVMMVITMVPMMAITASAVDGTVVTTRAELNTALKDGGNIIVGADISGGFISGYAFTISKDTTIYGNGHKLYAGASHIALVKVGQGVTFSAENVVFDCKNKAYCAVMATTVNNNGCTINLTDCTVMNSNFSATATNGSFPAVHYFGDAHGTLTNCTFKGNKGSGADTGYADVFVGAEASIIINGGIYDQVYVRADGSQSGTIVMDGNAIVGDTNGPGEYAIYNAIVEGDIYVDCVKTTEAITTLEQLKTAAANGGTYALGADIEVSEQIDVANNLKLYGNRKTLKAVDGVYPSMLYLANENATLTISDATIDVNSQNTAYGILAYTGNGGNNPNNIINLTDCTVKNAKVNSYAGAVNQFGSSKGFYTNCTFTNNQCLLKDGNNTTGADIWAGSKAKVYIYGGTYDEVFIHASSSAGGQCYVSKGAVIDVFNFGYGAANPSLKISGASTINTVTTWNETNSSGKLVTGKVTIDDTSTIGTTYTNVDTEKVLRERVAAGDNIRFANNIEITSQIDVAKDLTIDGNGQTLKANGVDRIFDTADAPVVLTFNDLTLDCNNVADFAIHTSEEKIANQDTAVYMTDCTVKNSIGDYYNHAAVYLYSRATGYFENCTFVNNTLSYDGEYAYASGADIWSGAATNVTIKGGSYNQVFINANKGGGGNVSVEGDATINELSLESDGKTATATIADTATVTKVNVGPKEAVLTKDGKVIGTSGECATPNADDEFSSKLSVSQRFTKNFELMGVQKKSDADDAIRFVSVIDADLIAAADDYGYIIGTTTKDRLTAMQNAGNITLDNVPHLAVSCKETDNQLSGDYGLYDTDTNYKYVTAAIENITDPNLTILARVYVKCGDKTYYGDYITGTATYAGCATSLDYLVNA